MIVAFQTSGVFLMKVFILILMMILCSSIALADVPLTNEQIEEIEERHDIDIEDAFAEEMKQANADEIVNVASNGRTEGRLTIIEGTVYLTDTTTPVPDVPVKVYCIHNNHTNRISRPGLKTNDQGFYTAWTFNIIPRRRCSAGDEAYIVVRYQDEDWESEHLTVEQALFYDHASINAWVGAPEFSVWTVGIAVVFGAMGLAFFRSKV